MEKQSEQQEIKDIITSREDGFGHRLKIARNERNLSTADVARELRLDEKIILALESEDLQRLPVSAFVCGYIRNYAKLLNVQPEPLVDYYKKEISEESLDPELKITKGMREGSGFDVAKVVAPIVLVLVIVILFFGGWKLWNYISSSNIAADDATQPAEISESVNNSDTLDNNAPDSLLLPALNESNYVPPEEESQDLKLQASVSTTEPDEISVAVTETSSADDSAATEGSVPVEDSISVADSLPLVDTLPVEDSLLTQGSLPAEPEISEVAASANLLVLEFTGNSWIIIKDAEDKKLATGLKKARQTLQLQGKTPYNVFLGDGRVVKVSIHGKRYDHSKYINDKNIARFKVE